MRLSSGHFDLYTNGDERLGRQALSRLHQVRQVFRGMGGGARSPVPLRVVLFGSESEFRPFALSEATAGYYQTGPEHDYIVLFRNREALRIASHEYVHSVLTHSSAQLPKWLEEGIAEFYSTVEPSGERLRIGKPVPAHLEVLAAERWLEAGALWQVTHESPFYNERGRAGIFYAQSWALVHMLNLSPAYRNAVPRFAGLLAEAVPAAEAFATAFGKPLEAVLTDLGRYLQARNLAVVELGAESAPMEAVSGPQPLGPLEVDLLLSDLLIQTGKIAQAEKLAGRMVRNWPESPEVQAAAGVLAVRGGDREQARRHLRRAIELGSRNGSVYFEYAALLREARGDAAEIASSLARAVELNPGHAEAHFLRGLIASGQGRREEAVEHLRRAAAVLPRQANFWHALALEYHHLGQKDLARRSAYRALDSASSPQEAEMARAAIRLADSEPAAAPVRRPAVTTPDAWRNPQGDRRVEGVLEEVECGGPAARFRVRDGSGRILWLLAGQPGKVEIRNAGGSAVELQCGSQKTRVAVEYLAQPDAARGTAGQVTALEFR
jgi:tetratricopeptide (TPR) repeat protein